MTNPFSRITGATVALCLALSVTASVEAQSRTRLGVRGGAGIDRTGQAVYIGQVDVTDIGASHSVEVALAAFGARLDQAYSGADQNFLHEYEDRTRVEGVALVGSVLVGHARSGWWPYVVAGLGVGPLRVDWRKVSPTDVRLGTSMPSGGSFREESVVKLGSVLRLGLGWSLHDRLDVRAQGHAMLVPSTVAREDMKVLPTMTLSTGFGL